MTEAAAPETTPAKEPKPPKDEQHGVTRPKAGTSTGAIWAIADEMSAAAGAPAARKDVLAAAVSSGLNVSTAATQYGRWRRYHGLGAEPKPAKADSDVSVDQPAEGQPA